MNEKEIEKIIRQNNIIEQNIIIQEKNLTEKNIIQQTKKINPFIEIIDSSRLDDNLINLNSNFNKNIINNSNKETIKNKEINNQNSEINNYNNIINEEPMTFNQNKEILINNESNGEKQDKNFLTFKKEDENEEIDYNLKILNDINSEECINQIKLNEDNFSINDIILILKKLINKMKFNINKNYSRNNIMKDNNIFVDKIKEIKNNIIKIIDNIIEEETLMKNKYDFNNINFYNNNNEFAQKYNLHYNNFYLNKKLNEIDEIENTYKTQIRNLKKRIENYELENNSLKKIIQTSQYIFEDLISYFIHSIAYFFKF